MMQPVIVLNREKARKLTYSDYSLDRAIISICNACDEQNKFNRKNNTIKDILFLSFDDVLSDEKNCMTKEDAIQIVNFFEKNKNRVDQFVVHCDAGISRSAGVAAGLLKGFYGDDSSVYDNPIYCPNSHCYKLVLNEIIERRFLK